MTKPQIPKALFSLQSGRRLLYSGAAATLLALVGCSERPAADSQDRPLATAQQAGVEGAAPPIETATDVVATEQTYASAWGPQIGSQIPRLAASDHTGQAQTLDTLGGEKGLLLVFSRSADW